MTKQEIRDTMLEVKADFEHANRYEQLLFRLMLAMNTPTTRKKVKTDDNTLEKCCEKCGKPGLKYRMRGKLKVWRCEEHRFISY